MKKNFFETDWKKYLPRPVCEDHPEYDMLYQKAWELAHDHVKHIEGMPQTPYMDEAFCDTQIWIWDTCFMTLFCKYAGEVFPGIESLKNFYGVLHEGGSLPEVIPTEREPAWTGAIPGVPKTIDVHIADNPPLFAWAEYENALFHGNADYVKDLLYRRGVLQKHYEWIESLKTVGNVRGVLAPTCLIHEENGYKWEGARSGMDNTPRGKTTEKAEKERPNNPDMLWIDAICEQALAARMISRLFALVGDEENASVWKKKYEEKKDLVNRLYWDEKDGFYYDIDVNTHAFYKTVTTASFWALTAGIASEEQARRVAAYAEDEKTLGGAVPLLSLSRSDPDFTPSGKYWRGSLWLPTAYASLKGLAEYKHFDIAHEAARKILDHMLKTYLEYEPHTIWECYAPCAATPGTQVDDEEIVRKDFCGWSALGPIAVYIEYLLGFHTVNAFERTVEWEKPAALRKTLGIRNLRFGGVVTDIIAEGNSVTVESNAPYTLKIGGKPYPVQAGTNRFVLD